MFKLIGLIKGLVPHPQSVEQMDRDYLNSSVDIYTVERRMSEIDRRDYGSLWKKPDLNFTHECVVLRML